MQFWVMTIFVLIHVFFLPQVLLGQEGHNMEMQADHSQMMAHPEKMDGHMMAHHEHIKTMERVFRYERNLYEKSNEIKVGYLYKLGDAAAEKDKNAMLMMSKTMVEDGLAGKPIFFTPIGISKDNDLNSQLSQAGLNVIYIGSGLNGQELDGAKKFAAEKKILTMGSSSELAENGTAAIGIVANNAKVDLIINLETASKLSADFDPRLYRLASKVIK
jgi:hypothetical protein